jgi:DNA-binding NarL/FixJ family response regulator
MEMESVIRVFVLSDNRLFREALVRILSKKNDIETVASRQCGCDAVEDIFDLSPDVLLLDSASFLFREGSRLSREQREAQKIKLLLVGMQEDEELFLEVVRQGAMGFVPREASAMDVVAAIRAAAQGEAVCPARLCKRLFDFVAQHAAEHPRERETPDPGLTRREEQLLPLIGRGLTNKEIAAQLNLSEKTVKNHVHRILRKMGLENRLGLMAGYRSSGNRAQDTASARSIGIS